MRIQALNRCESVFSTKNVKVFYAVGRGKETGIYDSWKKCKLQIQCFPNAKFKKFNSSIEAEKFVKFWASQSALNKNNENKIEKIETENSINSEGTDYKNLPSLKVCTMKSKAEEEHNSSCQGFSSEISFDSFKVPVINSNCYKREKTQEREGTVDLNFLLNSFKNKFNYCLTELNKMSSELSNLKLDFTKLTDALSCNFDISLKSNPAVMKNINAELDKSPRCKKTKKNSDTNLDKSKTETKKKKKMTLKPILLSDDISKNSSSVTNTATSLKEVLEKIKNKAVNFSFTYDEKDRSFVKVYTDGAATFKGGKDKKAGIGIWFGDNHPLNLSRRVVGLPTNNLAEIQAARMAITVANKAGVKKLKIFTDSSYLISCATKWIYFWKKNGWLLKSGNEVKHKKELEKLYSEASKIKVLWEKVPGHAGVKGNMLADQLANRGLVEVKRLTCLLKTLKQNECRPNQLYKKYKTV